MRMSLGMFGPTAASRSKHLPVLLALVVLCTLALHVVAQCSEPGWMATAKLPTGSPFSLSQIATDLDSPDAMAFTPDGRLFVLERIKGTVRVINAAGQLLPTPAITLSVPPTRYRSAGARGIAVDPDFASGQPYIYVLYMRDSPRVQRVARYTVTGDVFTGSEEVLVDISMTQQTPGTPVNAGGSHNGGALVFDSAKRLIITVGDGWNPADDCCGGDPSQDLSVLMGKVLRLDRDGTIPSDNPFVGTAGARTEIYAVGFRNPFSAALGPDGNVYINDVVGGKETVFRLVSGGNYGWRSTRAGVGTPQSAVHSASGLITGGVFYSGVSSSTLPAAGDYVLSDWKNNRLRVLRAANLGGGRTDFATGIENPAYVLESPSNGDIYFMSTTYETACGAVFRLAATGATQAPPPVISPAGGTYNAGLQVLISSPSGDEVHYTTDGSTPVVGGSSTSILLPDSTVELLTAGTIIVRAMVVKPDINASVVVSATYVIEVDETAPTALSASLLPDRSTISVVFSEAVQHASVVNTSRFSLSLGAGAPGGTPLPALSSIVHAQGQPVVALSFSSQLQESVPYLVTVDAGVRDVVGNILSTSTTLNVSGRVGEVVHLAFDDAAGQGTAVDSLGLHNGQVCSDVACNTLQTGAWLPTGGLGGRSGALDLAQTVDHVDLGSWELPAGTTGITVSVWFYAHGFDVPGSSSQDGRLVSRATGVTDAAHYVMLSTMQGQVLRARVKAGGTTDTLIAQQGALNINEWTMATLTYDGTTMVLYKNADSVASAAHSQGGLVDVPASSVPWWVGNNPTAGARPMNAIVDDVRIYNRALTAAEVSSSYEYALNVAPTVEAGPNQTMTFAPGQVFHFEAVINDDGLPSVPGRMSVQWTVISGNSSAVSFDDPQSWHTHPSFTQPGVYTFQITVSDGILATSDTLVGTVLPDVPTVAPAPVPPPTANPTSTPTPAPTSVPTVFVAPTPSPSQAPTPAPSPSNIAGLSAHLAFNDAAGQAVAVDSLGLHNGQVCSDVACNTLQTGAWLPGTGGLGGRSGALDLAQTVDHVDLGSWELPAGTTGVSVSVWFYAHGFDVSGSSSKDGRLVSRASSVSTGDHYVMLSTITGPYLRGRIRAGGTTDTLIASQGALNVNEWTMATLTYDGTTMVLYKNADSVASAAHSQGGLVDVPTSSVPWWVGNNPTTGARPMNAIIDDMRIYNRALTAAEVSALHAEALATPSPTTIPTQAPSAAPTSAPSSAPSQAPSAGPTLSPTALPTDTPTNSPSTPPTAVPTTAPTSVPTQVPTSMPTAVPSTLPTVAPTGSPTTSPTTAPTAVPGEPTSAPTPAPTSNPTTPPTTSPTSTPTTVPTALPTSAPTSAPTTVPTALPSASPTSAPTDVPSSVPSSAAPTAVPSAQPTTVPSQPPSIGPSLAPTQQPTSAPTATVVPSVEFRLRLRGWSYSALAQDSAQLAAFSLSLRQDLAMALSIRIGRVVVVSMSDGSVIARIRLEDPAPSDSNRASARMLMDRLRTLIAQPQSVVYTQGQVTNTTDPSFFEEETGPSNNGSGGFTSSILFPVLVGGVVVILVVAAIIWRRRHKAKRPVAPFDEFPMQQIPAGELDEDLPRPLPAQASSSNAVLPHMSSSSTLQLDTAVNLDEHLDTAAAEFETA